MYETQYDKLQPYFTQEKLQCPNMDTDIFGLSMKTEIIIKDSKISEDIVEFNNYDENHELFSVKSKN